MFEDKNINFPNMVSNFRIEYNELIAIKLLERGVDDLASSYGSIIYNLLSYEEMTMKDLAEKIKRDASTVTVLVRNLEKKGYITKRENPKDTRSKLITLTKKGTDLKPIFIEISEEVNKIIWENIGKEEADTMISCFNKISNNIMQAKKNIK